MTDFIPRSTIASFLDSDLFHSTLLTAWSIAQAFRGSGLEGGYCHIHKITLSATPDLCSHIHQLRSTFTQLAVRTFQTSLYILLHYVPYTFVPSGLDSLLAFHHSCVQLWTQLWLYFSSVSVFVCIQVQSKLSYPQNRVKCNSGTALSRPPTLEHFRPGSSQDIPDFFLYSSSLCSLYL